MKPRLHRPLIKRKLLINLYMQILTRKEALIDCYNRALKGKINLEAELSIMTKAIFQLISKETEQLRADLEKKQTMMEASIESQDMFMDQLTLMIKDDERATQKKLADAPPFEPDSWEKGYKK